MTTSEHMEQVAYFEWVDLMRNQDERYDMIYAVPNGGHRHKAVAAKMKREGVRRGVLDINGDVPVGGYHGFRIEMKLNKKSRLTDEQKIWIRRYRKHGFVAERCDGFDEAKAFTEAYMRGDLVPF